ncbi:glycosyltransferase family 2 protein [Fischerella sp. PCC 9605]|uniref:glycosyltransferase family 2 protein n=1 Tax=Fischerella sp. PCC 9605 TaxID=1173024 RepID=UPI0004B2F3E0|nr:glycosyltransferase [Fischerella sp. PCC 9605]
MVNPQVTIVVVPRERFSYTRESLESIYNHTDYPFSLVYVDGGSPSHIQSYLEAQAQEKGFHLIRADYYLSPNRARNLGLSQVSSKYVIFIDNDVVVTPGWLNRLVQCAEETGAAIVGPLTCIGKPEHEIIHNAGGETHIVLEQAGETIKRRIHQKTYLADRRVDDVRDQLQRIQCEFVEFHCMLVRTEIFERIGLLDEGLLSTREHIDCCMTVSEVGGSIYCEREAVVTYVPGPPFEWSDLSFFMLRWSDAWDLTSLQHLRQKWNLTEDKYFKKRYERLGHRRHQAFIKPLLQHLSRGQHDPELREILISMERQLNRYISNSYAQNQPQDGQAQALKLPESSVTASSHI